MSETRTLSPDEALKTLLDGAERARTGRPERPRTSVDHRTVLAGGQHPIAAVLGCSDSRVPMEFAFDAGYGDLFAVRTAGHTLGETVVGSVEFAVAELQVPLVLVLGHTSCGAVTAADHTLSTGETPGGSVASLVERILPSVIASRNAGHTSVDEAVSVHTARTVERLREASAVLAEAEEAGRLKIVGAVYDLATGAVHVVL
ncbi:carbonic anhydrase [Galactobacter valiniphilus]|uniref:carbonic anhydrase n=1 Tax=Galactobacter valiniphilus TaxID=2676122 RepID=UPI003736442E